jgi:hypothetical protein
MVHYQQHNQNSQPSIPGHPGHKVMDQIRSYNYPEDGHAGTTTQYAPTYTTQDSL